jgi:hypothetical protein
MLRKCAILAALLTALAADAATTSSKTKSSSKTKADPRTVGLGHSCTKRSECKSKSQVCLKESDAHGKQLPKGFCALPCAKIDQGVAKEADAESTPAEPSKADAEKTKKELKKKPPPRCPTKYACRSAGAGVPIDLCVKE